MKIKIKIKHKPKLKIKHKPIKIEHKPMPAPKKCLHNDPLCRRYGCPDDPAWRGDGCK